MLLGDAETVVIDHSGLREMRFDGYSRFWLLEISVFDFQRTKKEGKSQRASPINNRPSNSVRDVVQKTGKQKEAARAREANNWRYTLMAR